MRNQAVMDARTGWRRVSAAVFSLLLLLLAGAAAAVTPAPDRTPESLLDEAMAGSKNASRYAAAVDTCRQILTTPKTSAPVKQRAFMALIETLARQGARQEAIDVAEALRLAYPNNAEIDRQAVFAQADQYLAWTANNKAAPAIARLEALTMRQAKDITTCGQAWLRIAKIEAKATAWDDAMQAAQRALATDPTNLTLGIDALWLQQDMAARLHQPENRLLALKRALDPVYSDALPTSARAARNDLVASTLRELKRGEELRQFAVEQERTDDSPVRRQQWCYIVAEACREDGQAAAALAAYERVFTEHADVINLWPDAQARIVDVLAGQGRLPEALRAAHVLWDAATDPGSADRATTRIAELLRLADGNATRADALVALLRGVPAGKHGKTVPADDAAPVLPTLGYPDGQARRQACEAAAAAIGDCVEASLHRGRGYLYAGDPRTGLAHFADALRRCPVSAVPETTRAVLQGFRAVRGQTTGLADVGQYIACGPSGPDGQAGTDDDVPDPFAALGLTGASRQPGGLTPLPDEETALLQNVIRELRSLAARPGSPTRRIAAFQAYQRTCEALVVIDRRETLAWVFEAMRRETDARALGALARLGQTVAKIDQLNLVDLRQFDADTLRLFEQLQRPVPSDVLDAQRLTERAVQALTTKKQVLKKR